MADRERLELRVSREWLDRLDGLRGGVPRGTFVKRLVEDAGAGSAQRAVAPGAVAPVHVKPPLSAAGAFDPETEVVHPDHRGADFEDVPVEIPLPKIARRRSF